MIKAVFFDAAGTLFEAREPVGHTYARVARHHGLDAADGAVSEGFRRAFSSIPGLAFGPGHSPDKLRRLERDYWYRLVRLSFEGLGEFDDFDTFFMDLFAYFADPAHWRPVSEAHSVLDRLKLQGLKLGVISNFDFRLYRILEGLDLRRYFDLITISSEAGFAKPAPEIFHAALSGAGVESAEALHVGDSETMDLKGAQEVGLSAILIDEGRRGPEAIKQRTARISSLAQIINVMQLLRST